MLFLSVPGSQTTQDRTTTRDNVIAVLPSSLPERSRHPDPSAFRSSIARPTDSSVYASSDISRCRLQDSRPGWIRCFLSCRALSSPTTCRFIPALSVLPTKRPECELGLGCMYSSPSARSSALHTFQAFGNSEKPPRNNGLRGALAVEGPQPSGPPALARGRR